MAKPRRRSSQRPCTIHGHISRSHPSCATLLKYTVYPCLSTFSYTFPAICMISSAECSAPPLGRGKYSWTRSRALVVSTRGSGGRIRDWGPVHSARSLHLRPSYPRTKTQPREPCSLTLQAGASHDSYYRPSLLIRSEERSWAFCRSSIDGLRAPMLAASNPSSSWTWALVGSARCRAECTPGPCLYAPPLHCIASPLASNRTFL